MSAKLRLKSRLSTAIEKWLNKECDGEDWESLNSYVGNNIHENMANAAFAVLEANIDVQDYLKEDGQLEKF